MVISLRDEKNELRAGLLVCRDCGIAFDEPTYYTEYLTSEGAPWRYYGCPVCGGGYEVYDPDEEDCDEEDE